MTQEEIQDTIRSYSDDLERLYDRIASIKSNIQYIQKNICNHPNMDNCQCDDCGYSMELGGNISSKPRQEK